MIFPPSGHVSGTNQDWPETWSGGVVAWGPGRPAQSYRRFLHPAVYVLIHQGPLEPVGGTAWEGGGTIPRKEAMGEGAKGGWVLEGMVLPFRCRVAVEGFEGHCPLDSLVISSQGYRSPQATLAFPFHSVLFF